MFPVTTSVQVTNTELESHGRAGSVTGNEQTHPVLTDVQREALAANEEEAPFEVDKGNVLVLLDGDTEPQEFSMADVRLL